MHYLDEKILDLRKQQKKERYSTLDTGLFINSEKVEFHRVKLFNENMSIMLPTTFVTMPPDMAKFKYPAEARPHIIKTSLDSTVNLGFSWIKQPIRPDEVSFVVKQCKEALKALHPANIFFDMQTIAQEDRILAWIDYKGYAIDHQLYNILFITSIGGNMLNGFFNCKFSDSDEWRAGAFQMIASIWDHSKEIRKI